MRLCMIFPAPIPTPPLAPASAPLHPQFGSFGFPMGLTLCVVAGADLFTSNCMYVVIGVSEGEGVL